MKIGIITWKDDGWGSSQLREAMRRRHITPICFSFAQLTARVAYKPHAAANNITVLKDLKALITRPIGRGSLEQIIFRMNLLHRLERLGMLIINPPLSIERSVDKYHALCVLEEHNVPVPRTAVTEHPQEALKCFHELGGDVIIKPIFGSRGIGSTRVSDPEIATRIFRTVSFYRGVLYLQEFVPHGESDIRAFVINDHVVASMRRVGNSWKTNVSLGATPVSTNLTDELEGLAVRAAEVIGCRIAGVDILEGPSGPMVIELNSQPGWKGLQSVSQVNIADEIVDFVLSEIRN